MRTRFRTPQQARSAARRSSPGSAVPLERPLWLPVCATTGPSHRRAVRGQEASVLPLRVAWRCPTSQVLTVPVVVLTRGVRHSSNDELRKDPKHPFHGRPRVIGSSPSTNDVLSGRRGPGARPAGGERCEVAPLARQDLDTVSSREHRPGRPRTRRVESCSVLHRGRGDPRASSSSRVRDVPAGSQGRGRPRSEGSVLEGPNDPSGHATPPALRGRA